MTPLVIAAAGVPAMTALLAGGIAAWKPPPPRIRSHIQHFAAGVVGAAAASELLPEALAAHATAAMAVGFAAGSGLMLAIHWLTSRTETVETVPVSRERPPAIFPVGLVTAVAIDVLVDGGLMGLGFVASQKAGLILALAFALETLSVGLAVGATMRGYRNGVGLTTLTAGGLGLLFFFGAVLAALALSGLGGIWITLVTAFGVAGLFYLALEGLLGEAHEIEDSPLTAAAFFAGFLLLLIVDSAT